MLPRNAEEWKTSKHVNARNGHLLGGIHCQIKVKLKAESINCLNIEGRTFKKHCCTRRKVNLTNLRRGLGAKLL